MRDIVVIFLNPGVLGIDRHYRLDVRHTTENEYWLFVNLLDGNEFLFLEIVHKHGEFFERRFTPSQSFGTYDVSAD